VDKINLELLRHLSIFETVSGEIVSVVNLDPMVLQSNFPASNLKLEDGVVFIRAEKEFEELYAQLKFKTVIDVYAEQILPRFELFDESEKKAHAEYLKDYFNNKEPDHEKLLRMLREVKMFQKKCGRFVLASSLCSPEIRLFVMFRPDDVVPEEYLADESWLMFMKKLGLNQEITDSELVDFATRLASDPSKFDEEAVVELVDELFVQDDMEIVSEVSRLEFLPCAASPLETLLVPQARGISLTCFRGRYFASNSSLCWSQRYVIAETFNPGDSDDPEDLRIAESLGVRKVVPEDVVVKHLDFVSEVVAAVAEDQEQVTTEYIKELEIAFSKLLARPLSAETLTSLSKLALLPVASPGSSRLIFVTPSSIVLNGLTVEDAIPPVLVPSAMLPRQLLQFQDFFQRMGAHSELGLDCYADVLNGLTDASDRQVIDSAFKGMITLLARGKQFQTRPAQLLMPSKDGKMISSSSLIFVDDVRLRDQLNGNDVELKDYDFDGVSVKAALENLPGALRPRFVSDQTKRRHRHLAVKMLRQATHDLDSAGNDIAGEGRTPSYQWACVKAHQVRVASLYCLHLIHTVHP
jgi:hypothetical protein